MTQTFRPHPGFSRRRARKISAYREGLLETTLPPITLDPAQACCGDKDFFTRHREDLRLEIGFGAGEHLLAQAERAPQVGFIGCEPYRNGVAALLANREVRKRGYLLSSAPSAISSPLSVSSAAMPFANMRLFADDALLLLPHLPDGCLSMLYLLFPDPWQRKRHSKRRLLREDVLDVFARLLRSGGVLRWSSDEPAFVCSGLAACCAHPSFCWRAWRPDDWRTPPEDWVETRYQRKAEQAGRAVFYAVFQRR